MPRLHFDPSDDARHTLITGDSGTGKSALIRLMMQHAARRGETGIVLDLKGEFVGQFLDLERGDRVLNVGDLRHPDWSPSYEIDSHVEAAAVSASFFNWETHGVSKWFNDAARTIFGYLLTKQPASAHELVAWMADDRKLNYLLEGTTHAQWVGLGKKAGEQSAGVRGALNQIANSLTLLPDSREATDRWSAKEWARRRQGWIFLTSDSMTLARQNPLTSAWMDMLLLRLMGRDSPKNRRVWVFLDELTNLDVLPQLERAITMIRYYNVCLVLGFQATESLIARYDKAALAMLSQPARQFFFQTKEPKMAKWISDAIAESEFDRMELSADEGMVGRKRGAHYAVKRVEEPAVFASEIQNLKPLTVLVKYQEMVTKVAFDYTVLPEKEPAFIPRSFPMEDPYCRVVVAPLVQSSQPEPVELIDIG